MKKIVTIPLLLLVFSALAQDINHVEDLLYIKNMRVQKIY